MGQTTVYRTLSRLSAAGAVIRVPAADGKQARYRYVGTHTLPSHGRMVCLSCGRTVLMECRRLSELSQHIWEAHHFSLDSRQTVLYGYCEQCAGKHTAPYKIPTSP